MLVSTLSFVIIVIVVAHVCHKFMQGYYGNIDVKPIEDNYDIGYISTVSPKQKTSTVNFYLEEPKQKSTKSLKKENDVPLPKECFKILKAIGYEESTARQIVKDFFKKNTANTLEEFFVKLNKHQSDSTN